MKTAMQLAIKEVADLWGSPSDTPNYTKIFEVLESKLEMEKQQIEDAYSNGRVDEQFKGTGASFYITKAEQYYNKTFKSE
jgi:hypothetical protein